MNAAKDRKTDDIRAYIDISQREAITSQARFTETLNVTVTPAMRSDIERFSEKHGVNKAQAVPDDDSQINGKFRQRAHSQSKTSSNINDFLSRHTAD